MAAVFQQFGAQQSRDHGGQHGAAGIRQSSGASKSCNIRKSSSQSVRSSVEHFTTGSPVRRLGSALTALGSSRGCRPAGVSNGIPS
jgi:hypothetical protein